MDKYLNRYAAGQALAKALMPYANRKDVLVLALPRGGVPVAFEIAKALHVPMDVFIVRKLGVPGHSELAMGAMASGSAPVFNQDIIRELQISPTDIDAVIEKETKELKRREVAYRGHHPLPSIQGKTILLVDDGIATGATMRAAIQSLRELKAGAIVVAVPVADKQLCERMAMTVDRLVCPLRPLHFYAVGAWYEDFSQTEDEEVYTLLNESRKSS